MNNVDLNNFQGPNYIHPESDLNSRPPIASKEMLKQMYPECFSGIGTFKNFKYHIDIDKTVKPVIHAPRKYALSLIPKIEKELDNMLENGILDWVNEPTDWVNSMVVREKPDGSLRICLDPKDLNKAIRREHYPVPTVDMVTHRLNGATLFSHLDAKAAYWNVELDDESSLLTAFNTHRGVMKYKRMSYGLKCSQDVFQKKMDENFRNCKGAFAIADDIQIYGTESTHDLHLHEAMERTRNAGLKLNYEKCVIRTKSCSFFGNTYTPEGVKPDPKKVEAIKKMEAPQTKQELQSFLGMITYLGQYVKNLSDLTSNLRSLLKKDALFQWTESHEANFQKLKESISSDTCLIYFDTSKPVTLQVDASLKGLGACLLQEDSQGRLRPVAYASKSLTSAETRYANIEREMLAVVFGCIKYHHYLYGRKFVCQSDHKPLADIQLKYLSDAPPRLQRLLLKLQPYDITIQYVPRSKSSNC